MLAAFIEWPLGKLCDDSWTSGFIAGRSLAIQPFKTSLAVLSTKTANKDTVMPLLFIDGKYQG